MITNHTPHLFKLRGEQTPEVTTRILVAPREGKFKRGEVLTLHESTKEAYSVTFIKYDGDPHSSTRTGTWFPASLTSYADENNTSFMRRYWQ